METKQNIAQKSIEDALRIIENDMQLLLSTFMNAFAYLMERTDNAIIKSVTARVEEQFTKERSKNSARSHANAARSKKGPTKRRV